MNKKKGKLIVWDFDGVIADTEKLWLQNRMIVLNEKLGLGWSIDTVIKNLAGISDKTKKAVLEKMGIITDDKFWDDLLQMDLQTMKKGFALTDGIADIFAMREFEQCIATGGIASKTALKIEMVKIEQYFPPLNATVLIASPLYPFSSPRAFLSIRSPSSVPLTRCASTTL